MIYILLGLFLILCMLIAYRAGYQNGCIDTCDDLIEQANVELEKLSEQIEREISQMMDDKK